jgi:hypothetical protein
LRSEAVSLKTAVALLLSFTLDFLATGGGFLQSYGDNYIDGNAGGENAPPSIAKK